LQTRYGDSRPLLISWRTPSWLVTTPHRARSRRVHRMLGSSRNCARDSFPSPVLRIMFGTAHSGSLHYPAVVMGTRSAVD